MTRAFTTVVFDIGGVLINWNPRYFYLPFFAGNSAQTEYFLQNICTPQWNEDRDEGRSFRGGEDELVKKYPQMEKAIRAWLPNFNTMMKSAIDGSVEVLRDLHAGGYRLLALTNWSTETYPVATKRFCFLDLFEGVVVSGAEKLKKPDPKIYRRLIERYRVDPQRTAYIDDMPANVAAAAELGFAAVRFKTPAQLRSDLQQLGFNLSSAQELAECRA